MRSPSLLPLLMVVFLGTATAETTSSAVAEIAPLEASWQMTITTEDTRWGYEGELLRAEIDAAGDGDGVVESSDIAAWQNELRSARLGQADANYLLNGQPGTVVGWDSEIDVDVLGEYDDEPVADDDEYSTQAAVTIQTERTVAFALPLQEDVSVYILPGVDGATIEVHVDGDWRVAELAGLQGPSGLGTQVVSGEMNDSDPAFLRLESTIAPVPESAWQEYVPWVSLGLSGVALLLLVVVIVMLARSPKFQEGWLIRDPSSKPGKLTKPEESSWE